MSTPETRGLEPEGVSEVLGASEFIIQRRKLRPCDGGRGLLGPQLVGSSSETGTRTSVAFYPVGGWPVSGSKQTLPRCWGLGHVPFPPWDSAFSTAFWSTLGISKHLLPKDPFF